MPASLTPQSLPPGYRPFPYTSPTHGGDVQSAGLYQTKNGLLVFFGSLRSRKSMTLAEISSSTVSDRFNVNGPSSLQLWFASVPSEDLHNSTGRGGVRQVVVLGSTAPGTSGRPQIVKRRSLIRALMSAHDPKWTFTDRSKCPADVTLSNQCFMKKRPSCLVDLVAPGRITRRQIKKNLQPGDAPVLPTFAGAFAARWLRDQTCRSGEPKSVPNHQSG